MFFEVELFARQDLFHWGAGRGPDIAARPKQMQCPADKTFKTASADRSVR
jgi:hypothetical protein